MAHPEVEKLTALLGNTADPAKLNEVVDAVVRGLRGLDDGMLNGVFLSAADQSQCREALFALGQEAVRRAVQADPLRRVKLRLEGLSVVDRPQKVDVLGWLQKLPAAPSSERPAPASRQQEELLRRAAEEPDRYRLGPPAPAPAIDAVARELGVTLPDDLVSLYRLCDGFALFCGDDRIGIDGSPFRLLPLAELRKRSRRVLVFDLANGDFLSWRPKPPGWVDDWREKATPLDPLVTASVDDILQQAFNPLRIGEGGRWLRTWHG